MDFGADKKTKKKYEPIYVYLLARVCLCWLPTDYAFIQLNFLIDENKYLYEIYLNWDAIENKSQLYVSNPQCSCRACLHIYTIVSAHKNVYEQVRAHLWQQKIRFSSFCFYMATRTKVNKFRKRIKNKNKYNYIIEWTRVFGQFCVIISNTQTAGNFCAW